MPFYRGLDRQSNSEQIKFIKNEFLFNYPKTEKLLQRQMDSEII